MSGGYIYEVWPGTSLVKFVTTIGDESETPEGWFFVPWSEGAPVAVESPAQAEAAAIAMLDSKQRVAILQISAIQSRIDAINDAIEFEEALPEEIAELPGLSALLILWKKYRIALGRVTTIAGWYQAPTWPIMPDPYTSETTASAPDQA